MSSAWRKFFLLFFIWGSPLILMALLTCHKWYGPDIWYHLTWGRDVLARFDFLPENRALFTQPLPTNLYWFFQTGVFILYSTGGVALVSLFFSTLWFIAAFFWIKVSRLNEAPRVFVIPVLAAFIICAQLRFDQRPEIYAYVFLLAQIFILTRRLDSRGSILGLFFLEVLMVNSHGYFALGPLLGAARVLGAKFRDEHLKPSLLALLALTAGSFVSPSPRAAWEMVFGYEQLARAMADTNIEMFPTARIALTFPIQVFWGSWALVFAYWIYSLFKKKWGFEWILALAGLYLGFRMLRNIPLFLILSAPLMGLAFQETGASRVQSFLDRKNWARPVQVLFMAMTLAVCGFVASGSYHRAAMSLTSFGIGLEPSAYPAGATEYLKSISFRGRVFTDSYDGGFVEFMIPEAKIAGDSYFYDPQTTDRFFRTMKSPELVREADRQFGFNALLINVENLQIIESYWSDPAWVFAFADSHHVIFLRADEYRGLEVSKSQPRYYRCDSVSCEDLSLRTSTFAPIAWMRLALQFGDRALALKMLGDLRAAPNVPSTVVRWALLFAAIHQDRDVAEAALPLRSRIFTTDPQDRAAIEKLVAGQTKIHGAPALGGG